LRGMVESYEGGTPCALRAGWPACPRATNPGVLPEASSAGSCRITWRPSLVQAARLRDGDGRFRPHLPTGCVLVQEPACGPRRPGRDSVIGSSGSAATPCARPSHPSGSPSRRRAGTARTEAAVGRRHDARRVRSGRVPGVAGRTGSTATREPDPVLRGARGARGVAAGGRAAPTIGSGSRDW
jgi:hypothetical protein